MRSPRIRPPSALLEIPDFDARGRKPPQVHAVLVSRNEKPEPRRGAGPRGKAKPPQPAARRFKPLTLMEWLGSRPLRPPFGTPRPPSFARLKAPRALPDGTPVGDAEPTPLQVEKLRPPDMEPGYALWLEEDGPGRAGRTGRARAHWHEACYHAGRDWGRSLGEGWAWMRRYYKLWWTSARGGQPLVFHAGHWWFDRDGVWFVLHEGEPWAWRYFSDWAREGLIHPGTGTRMVYSEDGGRVAVETPGEGTVVFDARTGEELAVYP